MANKRNILSFFGVAAATVLASGGSIFLTNTGLALIDQSVNTVQGTKSGLVAKETELPITVETFVRTEDSFDIIIDGEISTERETEAVTEKVTEVTTSEADTEPETEKPGETDSEGETEKTSETKSSETKTTETKTTETKTTEQKTTETKSTEQKTTEKKPVESTASVMYAAGNLNIRSSADSNAEVLATFTPGSAVSVLGDAGNGWSRISYNGQTAYVSSTYLASSEAAALEKSESSSSSVSTSSGDIMYATDYVYVRTDDNVDSGTLGTLATGETVSVVGNTGTGWIEVVYNGQTGYVGENYLSWDQYSSSSSSSGSNSYAWDSSYMMYDINSRYISKKELKGWSSWELAALRNEIFARHGRIFTTQSWADYFAQKTWYVPTYDPSYFDSNMGSFLNDCEWANLQVILDLEG